MSDVPTKSLERAGIVGMAAARVGINSLGHRIKRPFMSATEKDAAQDGLDNENARLIFAALSKLRGTAMKLGQLLGMEMDIFPPAYQKELEKSFYRVPPLNRTLVRKIIINELGAPPEEIFAEFDNLAFAAASLGQVHRATLKTGEIVAVKIQYPGINEAMRGDLKLMRRAFSAIPQAAIYNKAAGEIEARLTEELDYILEGQSTEWFLQNNRLPEITIPNVYNDFTTPRILTTQIIDGTHLNEWLLQKPSREIINQAAQNLYDFFVQGVRKLNRLHADPNPGNYLFRDDGSLGVIDFGCIKNIEPRFAELLPQLFKARLADDKAAIIDTYVAFGVAREKISDKLYDEFIDPFSKWSVAPLTKEKFNFGAENHSAQGKKFIRSLMQQNVFADIAEDFALVNRTIYGLCKMFELMGAEIECQSRWLG